MVVHNKSGAIKPHQSAGRADPQISIRRLRKRLDSLLRQTVPHLPGPLGISGKCRRLFRCVNPGWEDNKERKYPAKGKTETEEVREFPTTDYAGYAHEY